MFELFVKGGPLMYLAVHSLRSKIKAQVCDSIL